ncbi:MULTISPECIES: hypothetical protein [unclassified Streptomyces]|uniref:hypothetical protein n=1 Tax=unclassified Streptomyces TaxID=2593676 RepID=UPI002E34CCBF|nr:hypothetical protein [Streptomyces sp. NBC_01278]
MSHRRIAASAAVLAAGISLVPVVAHAAGPAAGKTHGVAAPDMSKAAAPKFTTFTSPAGRSARQAPAAGGSKAPAAPQAAETNPALAVGLHATTTTGRGLELKADITSAPTTLSVHVDWGDNKTTNDYAAGTQTVTESHTYDQLGTYTVKVSVTDQATQTVVSNDIVVTTEGSNYTPYGPTRLLDTRDGTGAPAAKVAPYSSAHLKIGGNGGIPAGVTAVVLNVTATNTTSEGHVTAFADGDEQPKTSNLNFGRGQTVPNLVIVPVGENGYVNLYNGSWESVDLVADVAGYFTHTAASGYTPMSPVRLVDTRSGLGTTKGQVPGQGTFSTQVNGVSGVSAGATAVALNVTVTNPKGSGHLTVYPSGQQPPTASNVNFTPAKTIANSVIVPVGPDGKISVRNGGWDPADVIVDVVGYYSPYSANAYLPVQPFRLLDTREWVYGPLGGRGYVHMPLASGYPHTKGFALNTTVTNTRDTGFLSVAPDPNTKEDYENHTNTWPPTPTSSTLNWTYGDTVPNLVQTSTGSTGVIDYWNQSDGDIDLVVDLFGVYTDN